MARMASMSMPSSSRAFSSSGVSSSYFIISSSNISVSFLPKRKLRHFFPSQETVIPCGRWCLPQRDFLTFCFFNQQAPSTTFSKSQILGRQGAARVPIDYSNFFSKTEYRPLPQDFLYSRFPCRLFPAGL